MIKPAALLHTLVSLPHRSFYCYSSSSYKLELFGLSCPGCLNISIKTFKLFLPLLNFHCISIIPLSCSEMLLSWNPHKQHNFESSFLTAVLFYLYIFFLHWWKCKRTTTENSCFQETETQLQLSMLQNVYVCPRASSTNGEMMTSAAFQARSVDVRTVVKAGKLGFAG